MALGPSRATYNTNPAAALIPSASQVLPTRFQSLSQSSHLPDPASISGAQPINLGPITENYQSNRISPQDPAPLGTGTFQPFLGFSALRTPTPASSGLANQVRLASSSAQLPRQPALPARQGRSGGRSGRGRSASAVFPSLPRSSTKPKAEHCLVAGSTDQEAFARITCHVYPPVVCSNATI